jgi:hypothetical protein
MLVREIPSVTKGRYYPSVCGAGTHNKSVVGQIRNIQPVKWRNRVANLSTVTQFQPVINWGNTGFAVYSAVGWRIEESTNWYNRTKWQEPGHNYGIVCASNRLGASVTTNASITLYALNTSVPAHTSRPRGSAEWTSLTLDTSEALCSSVTYRTLNTSRTV